MNDTYIKTTWGGLCRIKEKLIAIVNLENDDKNPRTINVMRRNKRFIVAMAVGS
jgi:hypothetical protein